MGLPFYNCALASGGLNRVIHDCYQRLGRQATVEMLDSVKSMGFHAATEAGISFAMQDLRLPPNKKDILGATEKVVDTITAAYREGAITDIERRQRVIDEWNAATDNVAKELFAELAADERDGHPT